MSENSLKQAEDDCTKVTINIAGSSLPEFGAKNDRTMGGDAHGTGIFIGTILLHSVNPHDIFTDKIADAFNNSSHRTLKFIEPCMQNGEVVIRPSLTMVQDGSKSWKHTAVGYILGKNPYFHHLNEFVRSIWSVVKDVIATSNGFYFFRFYTLSTMEEVIEGDISSKLPKHVVLLMPTEEGAEMPCKVDVEYEWLPLKCRTCMSFGHDSKTCPNIKKPTQNIKISVQRPLKEKVIGKEIDEAEPPPARETEPHGRGDIRHIASHAGGLTDGGYLRVDVSSKTPPNERRCVQLLISRALIDAALLWGGLNRRDHQMGVKEIIRVNRLLFLGILETRVAAHNIAPIQNNICPEWSWLNDYNTVGNRIWLMWNDVEVGLNILNVGDQLIHCRVTNRLMHTQHLITIIYGMSDVSSSRTLWHDLCDLAVDIAEEAWFVMGDFNAVLDMSELCGASGDIRQAMAEFQACVMEMGLITLPMQGERFTLRNCSRDGRSLWKQLDRVLANDVVLQMWPIAYYTCLAPAISDHSPLLLQGGSRLNYVSPFRFDNYLALSSHFLEAIKSQAKEFLATAQELLAHDRHDETLLLLEHCCRFVLMKAVKLEQSMLQQVTYLGLPLIASRLSIHDCNPLLIKIDKILQGWASIRLSFAARIQLIKLVLISLQIYWAMAFILPKGVIKEIEKRFRQFLWKGESSSGYPKVLGIKCVACWKKVDRESWM
ncbi:UNVERIFIED_CONTAM: hypothetical protein Sindi_1843700 [Sesamum indicum]